MKIQVISSDGHKIKLWLPTSLLKSKFILNTIKENGVTNLEPLINSSPIIFKKLKTYIKKQGHFTLVDIRSSGGDKVIIKI